MYSLVIACLLMLSGSMADRFGRRRVFQIGLLLFVLGSLLCSLAPGLGWLVAFRGLQAVGGSMLNPVAISIIANTFTDPKERGKAMGVWGSVFGLSLALGPVLGGLLVSGVGWRSIFWINVPIGVAVIVLTQLFVPESKAAKVRRLDPFGQALVVIVLGSLTYALIEGPRRGWTSPLILGLFVLTLVGAVALVTVERHRREPLIDMRFFRSAPFTGASLIAIFAFFVLGGFLFLNTLYLQDVRHYSALQSGLLTLPMAAMLFVFARVSGSIVGSRGPRLPLAGMPLDQAGVAGAIASTSRQVGSALGVAVAGSIVAGGLGSQFIASSHVAWAVIAGCGAAVVPLGFLSTGAWARGTAERNGERLQERATQSVS
jgi:EmrB/QacA subfamily drug resistance transporter